MCELCVGTFPRIATLEVARAAFWRQQINDFGPWHAVIEDCNCDDDCVERAANDPECTQGERDFGRIFLDLTEGERISALAKAANLWGAVSLRSKPSPAAGALLN